MFTVEQLPPDLPTPCLVVDGATVRANIARMAEYCREHRLNLRPHTKTHKSRFIAELQLAAGASGPDRRQGRRSGGHGRSLR